MIHDWIKGGHSQGCFGLAPSRHGMVILSATRQTSRGITEVLRGQSAALNTNSTIDRFNTAAKFAQGSNRKGVQVITMADTECLDSQNSHRYISQRSSVLQSKVDLKNETGTRCQTPNDDPLMSLGLQAYEERQRNKNFKVIERSKLEGRIKEYVRDLIHRHHNRKNARS